MAKVLLALALPLAGSGGHTASYLLLAAWAALGPRRAIEALTLTWLITFLNPGVYALSDSATALRWLVIFSAFVSVVFWTVRRRSSVPRAWVWVVVFSLTATGLSFFSSYALELSLLKLGSFLMGTTAVLLGFHLTRHQAEYWEQWFVMFFGIIIVAGLPLIVHELGYIRNQRAFQGLLNHPQAYGAFLAPFIAWLTASLFTKKARGWLLWAVVAIAVVSLAATQARVGVLAAVGGLLLASAWTILSRPGTGKALIRWIPRMTIIAGVVLSVAIIRGDQILQATQEFVLKSQSDRSFGEAVYLSRGFLIERSLRNFEQNRLAGIGFGLASESAMLTFHQDPLLGIPVGASVEKGFVLSAVLEEVGLVGFGFFLAMLLSLLRPILRRPVKMPALALALAALLINVGESVLFSLGGIGLLVWLLIGAARVLAADGAPS